MVPKTDFKDNQLDRLSKLGEVVFVPDRNEKSLEWLADWAGDVEVLGLDPDVLGGFEKAMDGRLTELLERLTKLRAIALSTSDTGWINLEYCKKRGINVLNIPNYSAESVAESTLCFLLGLAKKVFVSDRREQRGEYSLEMGFELKGKTLGIIGLGSIGSRVAELGNAIGMKVVAWNRTPKTQNGVEMKSLDEVLQESDAISINLASCAETYDFFNKDKIGKMKKGVIVANLADRLLVDEKEMREALKNEKVGAYAFEGDDLKSGPLVGIETAIGFQSFAWYTKDALERLVDIWVGNMERIVKNCNYKYERL